MESLADITDIMVILRLWEDEHQGMNYDPVPALTRIAEIIEAETDNYLKMDPDPFDERHPIKADPDCALGHILKVLFRKENFMTKLVNDYLRDTYWSRSGNSTKDARKLNIAACRLLLDIMPGLDTAVVFQLPEMESTILRFFSWAEKAAEPLQSYATGLLAAAMEVQDIATNFREQNAKLVPLMLKQLHQLQTKALEERHQGTPSVRPFAHLGPTSIAEPEGKKVASSRSRRKIYENRHKENGGLKPRSPLLSPPILSPPHPMDAVDYNMEHVNGIIATTPKVTNRKKSRESDEEPSDSSKRQSGGQARTTPSRDSVMSPPPLHMKPSPGLNSASGGNISECSNSSWAEMESYVIGNLQMYPPTISTRQILILRYLTPMGEYQEFLSHVFEHNALELILNYTNVRETKDSRLAFEALKYLAALLCHKKFSIEFINMRGLQVLLDVPRPSVAATGVSICFYYLAYCEDAMERVCQLPHHIISDLVKYSLWLLECSHDSGRCHATMFFGLSFQFRVILMEFDAQDGLRKLYNLISTLPILSVEDDTNLNDDEENSARQIVRHVCVALKRYLEAHLCIKAENVRRTQLRETGSPLGQHMQAKLKTRPDEVREQVQLLLEHMPFRSHWEPVDELVRLGGITLLLQIIAFAYEWNTSSGRIASGTAEIVRSALESLAICSVMPRVQLILCDRVDLPDDTITVGTNIILGSAEGEIVVDPDVQRAALSLIVNCVCAPIHRIGGNVGRFSVSGSSKKRTNFKSSEELIAKVWDSVRANNGIMVLLQLMMVKTPITDADSIRALACQALAGLARSETVRQIVGKLPLFSNGQLQLLMRDPILQDKRQEHVLFQKYVLELMERVSGRSKPSGAELEISLAKMHKASVVAQTRIHFNDRQLYQLIHQHLLSRGLTESAMALHKEAGLPGPSSKMIQSPSLPPQPYRVVSTPAGSQRGSRLSGFSPVISRPRVQSTTQSSSPCQNKLCTTPTSATLNNQPIRLIFSNPRKTDRSCTPVLGTGGRSLQKQFSYEQGSSLHPKTNQGGLSEPTITLDSIITEYLTNQHALCRNPVVPCPQFNLFVPHKCPDPKAKNSAPTNFTSRVSRRAMALGNAENVRLDRRLVHSRFCPVKTFRLGDEDGYFTCCEFLPSDHFILMGTHHGEVKMFNLHTGVEELTYTCHESRISHLQCNREGTLLLTSSQWQHPLSALWSVYKFFDMKLSLPDEDYVEFSNLVQDRIIATKNHITTIYDVATGKKIQTLTPQISNQYTKNRATFNPTDELVLSDGVLWDVMSGKEIHKLDKLNQTLSGVFHPSGLEVVCNSEVWDLRTFHLLRTVPVLDQCEVIFSPNGSIIYTRTLEQETEDELPYDSSFKTLDAFDYSSIATIDVKKYIYDLACNEYDTQIAIVENQGILDSVQESYVRVYDVGRRRDDEDEGEEEEDEEEEMDGSDDGSGSQSGSDDEQHEDGVAGDRNPNDGENNANGENPADDIIGSDSDDDILVALTDSGADSDETDEMWVA